MPNVTGTLVRLLVLNSSPSRSLSSGKLQAGGSALHQAAKSELRPHHNHFPCPVNLFNQNGNFVFPQYSEFSSRKQRYVQHTHSCTLRGCRKAGQVLPASSQGPSPAQCCPCVESRTEQNKPPVLAAAVSLGENHSVSYSFIQITQTPTVLVRN